MRKRAYVEQQAATSASATFSSVGATSQQYSQTLVRVITKETYLRWRRRCACVSGGPWQQCSAERRPGRTTAIAVVTAWPRVHRFRTWFRAVAQIRVFERRAARLAHFVQPLAAILAAETGTTAGQTADDGRRGGSWGGGRRRVFVALLPMQHRLCRLPYGPDQWPQHGCRRRRRPLTAARCSLAQLAWPLAPRGGQVRQSGHPNSKYEEHDSWVSPSRKLPTKSVICVRA